MEETIGIEELYLGIFEFLHIEDKIMDSLNEKKIMTRK